MGWDEGCGVGCSGRGPPCTICSAQKLMHPQNCGCHPGLNQVPAWCWAGWGIWGRTAAPGAPEGDEVGRGFLHALRTRQVQQKSLRPPGSTESQGVWVRPWAQTLLAPNCKRALRRSERLPGGKDPITTWSWEGTDCKDLEPRPNPGQGDSPAHAPAAGERWARSGIHSTPPEAAGEDPALGSLAAPGPCAASAAPCQPPISFLPCPGGQLLWLAASRVPH